jgi:hypothetical protein
MGLPSPSFLRPGPPPDDLLMVVRGGTRTLSDAHLTNQVGDCWERYQFFGVSVFGVPGDDLVALSRAVRAIRIRPVIRVTRCGALRSAGFEVMPAFPNPFHSSVVRPMPRRRRLSSCVTASGRPSRIRATTSVVGARSGIENGGCLGRSRAYHRICRVAPMVEPCQIARFRAWPRQSRRRRCGAMDGASGERVAVDLWGDLRGNAGVKQRRARRGRRGCRGRCR